MTYKYYQGVMKERISKLALLTIALLFAFTAAIGVLSSTMAATTTFEFTQAELDTNWEADREFPTDGVTSVSAFDRDDVARLGINSDETDDNTFRRTEGIKTIVGNHALGNAVEVDLYVDADWENKAVRAGIWVVGDDGEGTRDNLFGILEFVNLEPSDEGESAEGDHEGWRWWDSINGWENLDTDFTYGEWHSLKIELDGDNQEYNFYINGELEATGIGGENSLHEVFLNSYNYGLDEFPTLSNDSYAAHWHGGIAVVNPSDKDECKKGGWAEFGFRNQGQCVSFVNTGRDSR